MEALLHISTLHYMVLSAALFLLGVIGVLTRRNVVIVLMSIELILNAVNLNLVAFSHYWQRMMGFARAHPGAIRFMDLHHHGAYLDAESRALSRNYLDVAEAFARRARVQGAIRDLDPVLIVALMWGAAAGLVKFSASGALALDEISATAMEDALWRAIANEGA